MASPTSVVRGDAIFVRRFEVSVVEGQDAGARARSDSEELTIGTAPGTTLQLTDGSVSRHHCAIRATERGFEVRDLGSTNGTFVGDTEIVRGYLADGVRLRLGTTTVRLDILDEQIEQPLAPEEAFGDLLGASPAMRRLYPLLATCAAADTTVLLHGETGTGKELVAEAIHAESPRCKKPFVVVDCSALARDVVESELFGHVRGAFTGADADRAGAFEEANGGTIFLDEVGELPLAIQPLLLRVLENRTVRRIGTNQQRDVDVRVVAASHRDLRALVNEKRFRADLFYRLDVVRIVMPPLREREGDVELLARHFWQALRPDRPFPDALLGELAKHDWPGNVRELRNVIERTALVGFSPAPDAGPEVYGHAKERAIADWERRWVQRLLAAHDHNYSRAARAAQMGRNYLRQLARRYGLARPDADQ